MKSTLVLVVALLGVGVCAWGQTNGDYRSAQTGNWGSASTWETFSGGTWIAAVSPPTSANGVITIRTPHIVTVAATVSVDQVVIQSGGEVVINSGFTWTLANGTGNEFTVDAGGVLTNHGTVNFGATAREAVVNGTMNNDGACSNLTVLDTFTFGAGGTYNHDFTDGGVIPSPAIWNATSNMVVRGFSGSAATAPTNLAQNFGNFIWNSPNMDGASEVELGGNPAAIQGDMTFESTGDGIVFYTFSTAPALNIGGDLVINSGAFFYAFTGASAGTLTVAGDVRVAGTLFQVTADSNVDIDIGGDFNVSGGTMDFCSTSGTVNVNLAGSLIRTSGSYGATNGIITITFDGGGPVQNFSSAFTPFGALRYVIDASSTLAIDASSFIGGGASSTFTLNGTLQVASTHASGAIQTGTSNGNIRVAGTRTYNSGSTIVYNGSAAQALGNGYPATTGVNLTINNSAGVTLVGSRTVGGNLTLTSGNLGIGANTLTIVGTITANSNFITLSTGSNLTINGTGAFGTLRTNGTSMNNFVLNRASGSVTLGTDLTIAGTFTQTAGNLDFSGARTLTISGIYSQTSGNLLFDASSTLVINGTGTLPASLPTGSSTIGTLEINRSSTTVTMGGVTVNTQLKLFSGTVAGAGSDITMGSGALLNRGDGSITKTVQASSYDLTYSNSSLVTTGNELVTSPSTALRDLTSASSGGVTLGQNVIINRNLALTGSGSFNSNSKTITLLGNLNSSGANAFGTSTFTFGGTTTISGSTALNLGALSILSGASLDLGTATIINISGNFDADNGGTMTAGTSSTTFNGNTTITISATGNSNASSTNTPKFNNVTIGAGNTLIVSCSTCGVENDRPSIQVAGNWNSSATGAVFDPSPNTGGGIVTETTFVGSTQSINMLASSPFWDLTTSGSGTITLSGLLVVENDFVLSGTKTVDTNTANDYPITIGDDMIFDGGTLTLNESLVTFSGGTGQNIDRISGSGTPSFYDITVNKTGGTFTIATNVDLRNKITISSNTTVDFDGSANTDVFTLLSTSSGTAVIAPIVSPANPANVTGNITAQRYMDPARQYRYIGPPVASPTVLDLQGEIPVTGSFTGTSYPPQTGCTGCAPCTGCTSNNQSMFVYTESLPGTINARYTDFPANINTETMTAGAGYAVFVRNSSSATTLNLRGVPNKGDINITVSNGNDGWNLVSNPYPARLDWSLADGASLWTRTNIDPTIYIWDETEQNYLTYNRTFPEDGSGGIYKYISVAQAFWVHASGAPTLTAREGVKSDQLATFHRESAPRDLLTITIAQDLQDDHRSDRATLAFNYENATIGFDQGIDSYEFPEETLLSIHSLTADKKRLAVNAFGEDGACSRTAPLGIGGLKTGTASLNFSNFESFTTPKQVYLFDRFLNRSLDVKSKRDYVFEVTADSASFATDRFVVYISNSEVQLTKAVSATDICAGASSEITIKDSQEGITYRATVNGVNVSDPVTGNGEDIVLTVPGGKLLTGINSVSISAELSGCLSLPMTNAATVNVTEIDAARISVQGVSLVSSYDTGNQWYLDGQPISGATGKAFTPTESGRYSVTAQVGECTASSAPMIFEVMGVEDGEGNGYLTVYPNPTTGVINIVVHSEKQVKAGLYSILGNVVGEAFSSDHSGEQVVTFDLTDRAGGIYLITVQDGVKTYRRRIVKK